VPLFGDPAAWLAIVGLAPGLKGANRTGRPFTGDGAGGMLFEVLLRLGLAEGIYAGEADDDLRLMGAAIVNAVRCVPPQNKPTPEEMLTCRPFHAAALTGLPNLRVVVALGQIAHQSAVKALGGKLPKLRFAHGAEHRLPSGMILIDSYHCSRLNQNTGVLTAEMLAAVFARAMAIGVP
jgi:uracil-DNA glycosylase family 4